jgi:hypothetical protein
MVQRVLIQGGQASAMRVSMPGVDVTTADVDQTIFDSRWSGLIPYRTAVLTSVSNSDGNFFYGETLDQPPMCVAYCQTLLPNGQPASTGRFTPTFFRGGGTDNWWILTVTQSYCQFKAQYGNQASACWFTLFKRVGG